jgi:hypothetical protein
MTSLRKWLDSVGFDFQKGILVVQAEMDWDHNAIPHARRITSNEDAILDGEFDSGYGSRESPLFWARDDKYIYFSAQYDGSSGIEKISIAPDAYLNGEEEIPCPGG